MDSDYEKRLEAEIDLILKGLPQLKAPNNLVLNVLAEVQRHSMLPWYRRSWQTWPAALQGVSLMLFLSVFGGVCFGSIELAQSPSFVAGLRHVGGWFTGLSTIWSTMNALVGASVLVVKQLGTGFMIGTLAALAIGYATCVALGTVYVRLGLARR